MSEEIQLTPFAIVSRLLLAAVIGGMIGYERRMHHKAIGISGMVLVAVGSATYMLLGIYLTNTDESAVGRLLQGFISGVGFLGGAVIFKGGTDVRGIKTAAAIWITGAIGLAIGTSFWWLGLIVGVATGLVLLAADLSEGRTPREAERKEPERALSQAEGGR